MKLNTHTPVMIGNTRSTTAKMFTSPVFTQDSLQPCWQVASGLDHLCTCFLLHADYTDYLERLYLSLWLAQGLEGSDQSDLCDAEDMCCCISG